MNISSPVTKGKQTKRPSLRPEIIGQRQANPIYRIAQTVRQFILGKQKSSFEQRGNSFARTIWLERRSRGSLATMPFHRCSLGRRRAAKRSKPRGTSTSAQALSWRRRPNLSCSNVISGRTKLGSAHFVGIGCLGHPACNRYAFQFHTFA